LTRITREIAIGIFLDNPVDDVLQCDVLTAASCDIPIITQRLHSRAKNKTKRRLGYFPDSEIGRWKFQWNPIPGRSWKHDLIKGFWKESALTRVHQYDKSIRVDYIGNSSKFQSSAASSSS
jgi:hypothetical protein